MMTEISAGVGAPSQLTVPRPRARVAKSIMPKFGGEHQRAPEQADDDRREDDRQDRDDAEEPLAARDLQDEERQAEADDELHHARWCRCRSRSAEAECQKAASPIIWR